MDRQELSAIAHGDHPIAAPLGDDTVGRLLERAIVRGDERLLDLGCGTGEWLARAMEGRPALRAEGVDVDAGRIAEGRAAFAALGLTGRVLLHEQDAKAFRSAEAFDVVLVVGATHAFGGLLPTLEAARAHLTPGGAVLVGEGFWEREPDGATLDVGFGPDEYDDLATTVGRVTSAGWTPVYGHVSTREEWDDYEFSWTGTLSQWALDRPEHPERGQVLEAATRHRDDWLRGYRGTLGFVTLLLRRTPA